MLILIKGAGDIATGIAVRLKNAGMQVVMTEIAIPTTVRRSVAFPALFMREALLSKTLLPNWFWTLHKFLLFCSRMRFLY